MIVPNLLRNRITCLFFLVILLTSCSFRSEELSGMVDGGVADLRNISFADTTIVRLNGQWHFWEGELLSDADVRTRLAAGDSTPQKVPGNWSNLGYFGKRADLITTGTVALEVLLPPGDTNWAIRLQDAHAACDLSVNGSKPVSIGRVSPDRSLYLPSKGVEEVHFVSENGKALLVMRVANYDLPHTGVWMSPFLGTLHSIDDKRLRDTVGTALTSGAMLFMGLYHIALFLLRRKDRGVLVFAIICICMAARNMIMGERLMIDLFGTGWSAWHLSYIVEHLSVHMCVALFFLFFRRIYPNETSIVAVYTSIVVCSLWAFIRIFTPPMFAHRFLPLFEYFVLIAALYVIFISVRAIMNGREGAPVIVIGIGILILTVINDVLLSNRVIESVYLTSYGMFAFTFSQSFFLSRRFSNLFTTVERYLKDLQMLNSSLERFIPREMLEFLGKRSVVEIGLGNFIEARMTVFFLDIRNFTERSETMTPDENFRFINSFLEQFGPIVRKHGGFIDKYLGDGFMALFPDDPDTALEAALEMRGQLGEFNRLHAREGFEPVRFGIGIHTGQLMLGTIGENLRMDTTVISDTVNTASRLEELNKTFNTDILLSEETKSLLRDPDIFSMRKLSEEKVRGKLKPVRALALN